MSEAIKSHLQDLRAVISAGSSTRADSESEIAGGGEEGGCRGIPRTSGPDQASASRLIVIGFEKPLPE
eukprot:7107667-Pyramimonas_sp.AAC.1